MDDKKSVRIENKLDGIVSDVSEIKVTLALQHSSLEHHIRRTDILEKVVEPIHGFISAVKLAFKVITALALIAGIIEGTIRLLEFLNA